MGLQLHPSMRRTVLEELAEVVGAQHAPVFLQQFEDRLPSLIHEGITEQQKVSKVNHHSQHRGVNGIGQCFVRWAPKFRYIVGLLFGADNAADDKFLKTIERDNCDIKLQPTYKPLAQIVVAKPVKLETVAKEPRALETIPKNPES